MSLHEIRYTYAQGYRTRGAAESAIEDSIGEGEISLSEDPRVESYQALLTREKRYRISLIDTAASEYLKKSA